MNWLWAARYPAPSGVSGATGPGRVARVVRSLMTAAVVLASNAMALADERPVKRASFVSPSKVYLNACLRCHDGDGRGQAGRDTFPSIPDFTRSGWHAKHDDDELGRAILHGKNAMAPMKKKLGSLDVQEMVSFVRAFRAGGLVVVEEAHESSPGSDAKPEAQADAREPPTSRTAAP